MNVRIVTLPKGDDPDSFVKKHGVKGFEDITKRAKDLFDYKLGLLMTKFRGEGIRDKANIISEMLPTISIVDNAVVKSGYLKKLAESLGVHEGSLRDEMKKVKPDYSFRCESVGKLDAGSKSYISSELHVLGLAILDEKLFELLKDELGLYMFRDENIKKVMGLVEDLYRQEVSSKPGKLLSRLEGDESAKAAVVQAVAKADITEERERVLRDCMECMRRENMKDELKSLTLQLKKAQETKNDAEMRVLLTKINRIHKEKVGN